MAAPIFDVHSDYVTPILIKNLLNISSVQDTFQEGTGFTGSYIIPSNPASIKVLAPNGDETIIAADASTGGSYKVSQSGIHKVIYKFEYMTRSIIGETGPYEGSASFYITAVPNFDPLPKWNIRTVIDRVLNLCEPHMTDVAPRFKLDPAQAEEFEKIEAPEFVFTRNTLKEILDQIGGFIHGVPRIFAPKNGQPAIVHYDMLGSPTRAAFAEANYPYITKLCAADIESYATELDSTADNLVNTVDSAEGAVLEPYRGGYKTVRSEETYARINDANMIIETTLPIASIQSLRLVVPSEYGGGYVNLTPYVFEAAEYGRLSSFDGNYPTSKAYAIYYEFGQKNIKGLNFKSPNALGSGAEQYSIANIIKALVPQWEMWSTNWNDKYPSLAFQITYTPIFSARVLQHKPYIEPKAFKRSLVYNQGANLIETLYYGENLKGVIARMGNAEKYYTFRIRRTSIEAIKREKEMYCGQMWDDEYYISSITRALYPTYIDVQVGLSKDYNRLSQYIGINAEWRAYEVSERTAYNRDIAYTDYCVIGDDIESDRLSLMDGSIGAGLKFIANTFVQSASYGATNSVSAAEVVTYDQSQSDAINRVVLPVVSTAFGNALTFSFGYADNYSAGIKSESASGGSVSGYWQTDVSYTDYYGRAATLGFTLLMRGKSINYGDSLSYELPQGTILSPEIALDPIFALTGTRKFELEKDSKEVPRFNYCLQFVTTRKDIIIGSALTHNNPAVGGYNPDNGASLYIMPAKIGKFDAQIDVTKGHMSAKFTQSDMSIENGKLVMPSITSGASGQAWAIADSSGNILLACNQPISATDKIKIPNFVLRHDLP